MWDLLHVVRRQSNPKQDRRDPEKDWRDPTSEFADPGSDAFTSKCLPIKSMCTRGESYGQNQIES